MLFSRSYIDAWLLDNACLEDIDKVISLAV